MPVRLVKVEVVVVDAQHCSRECQWLRRAVTACTLFETALDREYPDKVLRASACKFREEKVA